MPEAFAVTPATGPPHVVGEQITVLAPGFRTDDYLPLGGSGRRRTTARTRHQRRCAGRKDRVHTLSECGPRYSSRHPMTGYGVVQILERISVCWSSTVSKRHEFLRGW